jgi:hypothetical protein
MNKKDAIRKYILSMADDAKFNVDSLAGWVNTANRRKDIKAKDVGNVILPLLKAGALTRIKNSDKYFVYTVIKNNVALWFAKHPIAGTDRRPNKPLSDAEFLGKPPTRKKNRSPFLIGIDDEIAQLNCKLKRLNAIRKEFA